MLDKYIWIKKQMEQRLELLFIIGKRREKIEEGIMSKQPPPAPIASAIGPCPTNIQIVGHPGTGSLPRTIAPPTTPWLEFINQYFKYLLMQEELLSIFINP